MTIAASGLYGEGPTLPTAEASTSCLNPTWGNDVRRRYTASLANLVSFLGKATEVHVFDNSADSSDGLPQSKLVFRMWGRKIVEPTVEALLEGPPAWAKPIIAAAVTVHGGRERRGGRRRPVQGILVRGR